MSKKGIMNPPATQEKVSQSFQREVNRHVTKVISEYNKAEKAFINIACEIAWLYHDDRYKAVAVGCNFEQFCEQKFGFKKTQAYALYNLVDRYGKCDENGVYTIEEQYRGYGQTQLITMLPLTDSQIAEKIRPDMSVSKIKEIVKELTKTEPLGIAENSTPAEDNNDSTEEEENIIDVDVIEKSVVELATYSSFKEFEDDLENILQAVADRFASGKCKHVNIGVEW